MLQYTEAGKLKTRLFAAIIHSSGQIVQSFGINPIEYNATSCRDSVWRDVVSRLRIYRNTITYLADEAVQSIACK